MRAITNNITDILAEANKRFQADGFEAYYIRLRQKEGRIYTDEGLKQLPFVQKKDRFFKEWKLRQQSSAALKNYLANKARALKILEVGCGNGWLSKYLSSIPGAMVTGIDINRTELIQARRVFEKENLSFIEGDIRAGHPNLSRYDVIIFAASIQYFSSLQQIISAAAGLLDPNGEIHILDTHFYKESERTAAQKRTANYYQSMGLPAFCMYYFHHTIETLKNYDYRVLYRPFPWNRLLKNKNPFTWYCIKP